MNKLKIWFFTYQTEIAWFLIGWLTLAGFHELQRGDIIGALIDFALAYVNYKLNE